MKYLTKEWYKTMQKTDMHLLLKTSKKAEIFSEEYYNELYKRKEKDWIKQQKDISNVKFEEAFPEYANTLFLSEDEHKEREKLLIKYNERRPFNPIQEKEQFKCLQKDYIKLLEYKLPTEILSRVADIRVLALERASSDVKRIIADYCKEQNMKVQKVLKDYQQYYDKELKDCKNKVIQDFNLHDSLIINIIKEKNKLIVELDSSGSFVDVKVIIFEDYEIIEEEMNFENGWWLYEEIYIVDDKYEIHSLIDVPKNNKANLGYFTVRAKNIILE